MKTTKAKIIDKVQSRLRLKKNDASHVVESLLELIKETLSNGDDVMISGFGKFCVNEKGPRKGRNPSSGNDMILPKRRTVTFKCSGKLRNKLNGS